MTTRTQRLGGPIDRLRAVAWVALIACVLAAIAVFIVDKNLAPALLSRLPWLRVEEIEVHRLSKAKPALYPADPWIAGIATDAELETDLPRAHLDDIDAVAAMVKKLAMNTEDVLAQSQAKA